MKSFLKTCLAGFLGAALAIGAVGTAVNAAGGWSDDGKGNFYLYVRGKQVLKISATATGTTISSLGSANQNLTLAANGSGTVSGVTTGAVTGTVRSLPYFAATTGALTASASATNGQIMMGSTGASPVLGTITAGTAVSVTNGAGSITIANTGVTSNVATTNQTTVSGATGAVTVGLSSTLVAPGSLTVTTRAGTATKFACFDDSGLLLEKATACQ